jgi:hypothetical protein
MQPQKAASISNQDQYNKSLTLVLAGNVSPGNGLTFASDGTPLTYSTDNMSGSIIRIGSLTNPNALPAAWTGNNTDLTIAHNLGKVPYGIIVIYKTAAADVFFGTVAPTDMQITLQTTNDATDTTIWLLA